MNLVSTITGGRRVHRTTPPVQDHRTAPLSILPLPLLSAHALLNTPRRQGISVGLRGRRPSILLLSLYAAQPRLSPRHARTTDTSPPLRSPSRASIRKSPSDLCRSSRTSLPLAEFNEGERIGDDRNSSRGTGTLYPRSIDPSRPTASPICCYRHPVRPKRLPPRPLAVHRPPRSTTLRHVPSTRDEPTSTAATATFRAPTFPFTAAAATQSCSPLHTRKRAASPSSPSSPSSPPCPPKPTDRAPSAMGGTGTTATTLTTSPRPRSGSR